MSTKEEKMAALQEQMDALAAEDDDDDYEIEIYSPGGHGARLPYRKGKSWLAENFGIDADTLQKPGPDGQAKKSAKATSKGGTEGDAESDNGGTARQSNLKFLQQSRERRAASE